MSRRRRRTRRGQDLFPALLIVLLILVIWAITSGGLASLRSQAAELPRLLPQLSLPAQNNPAPAAAGAPGGLPNLPQKPKPVQVASFQGCPPTGDGGDPDLNLNKNRVDTASSYYPVSFDALVGLPWPSGTERRDHAKWSPVDAAQIARYEGIPVVVEGYLAGARESEPESCNCHGADPAFRDWHLWLTKEAGQDRSHSIVVETTPRVRPSHPGWTLAAAQELVRQQRHVRISGWVMFDPEHPDQVGKTRGTIWEIHPIMQIEVEQQGKWVPLDEMGK